MRFWPGLVRWQTLAAMLFLAACSVTPHSDDPRAAGIGYRFGGAAHREFAAPLARVKAATTAALATYSLRIEALGLLPNGESIRARGPRGAVLIELERQGRERTQLRVSASGKAGIDRALETDLIVEVVGSLEHGPTR